MRGSCDFRESSADEEEEIAGFDCATAATANSRAQISAEEQVATVFSRLALKEQSPGEQTTEQTIAGAQGDGVTKEARGSVQVKHRKSEADSSSR